MSSAWLLPEHIADVLPAQAGHIEALRRGLVDTARTYGCELVMPPLLEHIESLLNGAGQAVELRTFKLVDQLSGRTLGVRTDTTPQVARIDAHLLNRSGVTRLCYCGPVLHALPVGLHSTREPLQFGAEIYGHAGLEADLEMQDLALECLRHSGITRIALDLGDARIVRGVLAGVLADAQTLEQVYAALASKDASALRSLSSGFPGDVRSGLNALLALYGDDEILPAARRELPARPLISAALDDLQRLSQQVARSHPEASVGFDLADVGGNGYYTGARFAAFVPGSPDALVLGGRYDEVGAVFGRNRPAVGFSLDVKALALRAPVPAPRNVTHAPCAGDEALRTRVQELRAQGETVVQVLPGHEPEAQAMVDGDRELVLRDKRWSLQTL